MTQQLDLMEAEVQSEAKRIAREMVRDPVALQSLLLEQVQLREKAEAQGLRDQLEEYFGADGYIEAAVVAAEDQARAVMEKYGRKRVLEVIEKARRS